MEAAAATDRELIRRTVLDYYEGWFDSDVGRMERALHPDLAKRRAGDELRTLTRARMVELTGQGEGAEDGADRRLDIVLEDLHGGIASATVRSAVYYEYLHLVRTTEGWKIANVLFELQ